jgi:hypothetical protein
MNPTVALAGCLFDDEAGHGFFCLKCCYHRDSGTTVRDVHVVFQLQGDRWLLTCPAEPPDFLPAEFAEVWPGDPVPGFLEALAEGWAHVEPTLEGGVLAPPGWQPDDGLPLRWCPTAKVDEAQLKADLGLIAFASRGRGR